MPIRRPSLFTLPELLEARRMFSGSTALPAGTGLTGDYYQGSQFDAPALVRTDSKVNFRWGNNRPDQVIAGGGFSARWTGRVQPTTTANYTFYTTPGTRLWVGDNLLVDAPATSGTVPLTAGQKYDLRLEYTSKTRGAAAVKLMWSTPAMPKQVIPQSALFPATAATTPASNLVGSYYLGANFDRPVMTRSDPMISFNWDNATPSPLIPMGSPYSVRWTGTIVPPSTGLYTFYTSTDDGNRLWVNGHLLDNQWRDQSQTARPSTIRLQAGQSVSVRMDYFENGVGQASAALEWAGPGLPRQTVSFGAATGHGTVAAPPRLTARAVGSTDVNLNWADVPNENGFAILRSTDLGQSWTPLATVPTKVTSYSDTSAVAGTNYQYRVGAIHGTGLPNFSNLAAAQTQILPTTAISAVPDGAAVTVAWDPVQNATSYQISRSFDGVTGWAPVGTVAAPTTTFDDTAVAPGTSYFYEVTSTDAADDAATSAVATATTPLATAAGITAVAIGIDANVGWTPVAGAADYLVERSPDGTTGWAAVGTTAAATLTDPGLANATTYYYRVTAQTPDVTATPSAVAGATTAPASAVGVTAVAAADAVTVGWNPVAGATGYTVQCSLDGSTGWTPVGTTTATTLVDPGLSAGTAYYYQVVSNGLAGGSPASNVAGAVTAPAAPVPVAIPSNTAITVSWPVVAGASSYSVRRSPDGVANWTLIATSLSPVSLVDSGLLNGTNYYYRVTATNGAGSSPVSAVAWAKTGLLGPALTAAVANYTHVALSWNAVAGATAYTVRRSTDNGATYTTVATTAANALTDTGLTPDTAYTYQVIATDGLTTASSNTVGVTLAPASPATITAVAAATSIAVAWSPVVDAASYLVERSPDGSTNWAPVGTTTSALSLVDTGLNTDTVYYYRVTAIDAAGASAPSAVASARTPMASPVLTAAASAPTTAALSWTAVNNATGYTVQRSTDGGATWSAVNTTAGTTLTDAGLAPGTTYTYQVIATDGTATAASNTTGLTLIPAAAAPTATAVGTTINVGWPAVNGATSYLVERSPDGSTGWTTVATPTAPAAADTALANGTVYYYRVTANNTAGASATSAVVNAKTALAAPTLSASVTNHTTVVLTWNAVTGATGYTVNRSTDAGATWTPAGTTSAATLSDSGLTPDTTYTYQVIATDGTVSTPSNTVAETLAPAAPSNVAATAAGTTVTVGWSASPDATSYLVERSPDGTTGWTSAGTTGALSLPDAGLSNGTVYYYRVTANNAAGASTTSTVVSAKTALAAPALSASVTNHTTVVLTWNAVTGATGYTARRSTDGGTTWAVAGTTSAATLSDSGLTPDTTYTYQVVATDGTLSTTSNNVSKTLAPAAPGGITATPAGTTITVAWSAAPDATSYLVERSANGSTGWTSTGTTSSLTLPDTGLSNGTTYYYRVTAIDAAGSSVPSTVASATTVPAAPASLTATAASDTQANLSWTAAAGATGYIVQVSANGTTGWSQVTTVTGTVANLGGLTASTTYYFRVLATNSAGTGAPSNVANTTTGATAPTYASLTTLYGLASGTDGNGFYDVYSIDQSTGADTSIGHLAFATSAGGRDPVSGDFFYLSNSSSTVDIDKWDPATNTSTAVATNVALGAGVAQATFRDDGAFLFTDANGDLYQMNATTGAVAQRGVIQVGGAALSTGNGDISFGPDGNLYMETSSTMYKIANSAITGAAGGTAAIPATLIGATGTGSSNNLQIAFGQNGTLFGVGGGNGYTGELYTINTTTGVATLTGTSGNVGMGDLASVPLFADLSVSQSATPLTHGQQAAYTITVTNNGPDGTVKPITVTDTLPAGLTFVSGAGTGWTFYVNGQTVQAVYAANAGAAATLPPITLTVAVSPGATGSLTNPVTVGTTIFDQALSNNSNSLVSAVG